MDSKKVILGLALILVLIFSFYSWNKVEESEVLWEDERIDYLEAENDSLKSRIEWIESKADSANVEE